jgi:F-type H+-transporting ATPase subunit epsilon
MAEENQFLLQIATPDKLLFSGNVSEVTAPGTDGVFGVLAGHANFVTSLRPGEVLFSHGGENRHIAVRGGFAEATPTRVYILVNAAQNGAEIDPVEAVKTRDEVKKKMAGIPMDDPRHKDLEMELGWAEARVQVSDRRLQRR